MRVLLVAIGLCVSSAPAQAELTAEQFVADFDQLWTIVAERYAYLDAKATDWDQVRQTYRPLAAEVADKRAFVGLLERVLGELYDPHAHLNVNTRSSPRLIPSGTDLWAEFRDADAVITAVKAGSPAAAAGARPGMIVTAIGGRAIEACVAELAPRTLRRPDPAARDAALRTALAGRRDRQRTIDVRTDAETTTLDLGDPTRGAPRSGRLAHRVLDREIGYVRVHDALGDLGLVADFDAALDRLRATRGLILDLRDTPGGGNTTVARGILGRFLTTPKPYQKHALPTRHAELGIERAWLELASPRGAFPYTAPVVVLVSRWTGSMGEGLAIGMDAIQRGVVVGSRMAGLRGATSHFTLAHSGFGVNLPTERLFHVDGRPRESFVPAVAAPSGDLARDGVLAAGLRVLREHIGAK